MPLLVVTEQPPKPEPTRADPDPSNPFPIPWPNAPWPSQASCPTCVGPVESLLAACWKRACLTADLDYDAALDRRDDI